MTDKPDPAAVEVAIARVLNTIAEDDDHIRISGRKDAAYVGDLRLLLAAYTALKVERDDALVEAYARATPIGAVALPVKRGGQS